MFYHWVNETWLWNEKYLENVEDHFMRRVRRPLRGIVEDGLEKVFVEVRRDDGSRVLLAIQKE